MSPILRFNAPAVALTWLIGWSLVTPASGLAQSVSSERALMNRVEELSGVATVRPVVAPTQSNTAWSQAISGEQALLGRSATGERKQFEPVDPVSPGTNGCSVDGAQALLGKCTPAGA